MRLEPAAAEAAADAGTVASDSEAGAAGSATLLPDVAFSSEPEVAEPVAEPVTVEAAHSKHRRTDVLPLRPDLVAELRTWLGKKPTAGRLFAIPAKAFLMLYADLAAAGVPITINGRVADFHALRHTFITMLGSNPANSTRPAEANR